MQEFGLEIQKVDWKMLNLHYQQGNLLMVDSSLDLSEVGEAFAKDQAAKVKNWIEQNKLKRPTDAQAASWTESATDDFDFLIVQPFVLAQRTVVLH